jgi:hypothetical protein
MHPEGIMMLQCGPEVHRQRKPYKQVVNDAIRRGLSPRTGRRPAKRYRVVPHEAHLRPGLDRVGFNRLADELEDAAVLGKRLRAAP